MKYSVLYNYGKVANYSKLFDNGDSKQNYSFGPNWLPIDQSRDNLPWLAGELNLAPYLRSTNVFFDVYIFFSCESLWEQSRKYKEQLIKQKKV